MRAPRMLCLIDARNSEHSYNAEKGETRARAKTVKTPLTPLLHPLLDLSAQAERGLREGRNPHFRIANAVVALPHGEMKK